MLIEPQRGDRRDGSGQIDEVNAAVGTTDTTGRRAGARAARAAIGTRRMSGTSVGIRSGAGVVSIRPILPHNRAGRVTLETRVRSPPPPGSRSRPVTAATTAPGQQSPGATPFSGNLQHRV